MADALPEHIQAAIAGPIDEAAMAVLRAHYLEASPIDAARADELFLLAAAVGDRATPTFKKFLEESLGSFLVAGFNPFRLPTS
jgi:hypothetical protein